MPHAYNQADVRCKELLAEICRNYAGGVREMISAASRCDREAQRLKKAYDAAKEDRHQAELGVVRAVRRERLAAYLHVDDAEAERIMKVIEGDRPGVGGRDRF